MPHCLPKETAVCSCGKQPHSTTALHLSYGIYEVWLWPTTVPEPKSPMYISLLMIS